MRLLLLATLFAPFSCALAGEPTLPGKPATTWGQEMADGFVQLSLHCVDTVLPNYWERFEGKIDPKERHPAFYGCYDWHSAVHGHWAMLRAWKTFPGMPSAAKIEDALSRHLTKENLEGELKFLKAKESFENPYGYGWYFRLLNELDTFDHPKAKEWRALLTPLADLFTDRYLKSLERLNRPQRVGTHDNTAYAMMHILDYASTAKLASLEHSVKEHARAFFLADKACPVAYEPGPYDFISPCLIEADLMRRVLPAKDFAKWEQAFLGHVRKGSSILTPVVPKDIKDPYLGHQIGLMFQKAASFRGLASALPASSPRRKLFEKAAHDHAQKGITLMFDSGYGGTHWLASFAIFHFSDSNLRK